MSVNKLLNNYDTIFWDFDGVIKDSVEVKTNAFKSLFEDFDPDLLDQIVEHHENNTGISRFEKIPMYLDWVGVKVNKDIVESKLIIKNPTYLV